MRLFGRWFGDAPSSTLDSLCLGIDYLNHPVQVNWRDRCILAVGESGSGKSGLMAALLTEAEPFVQAGLTCFYGIDLKRVELSASSGMFEQVATDPDTALALLDRLTTMMEARNAAMAMRHERSHHATTAEPRVVLVVDELAQLFRQDVKTAKAFQAKLTSILAMGRATGFIVWGFSQNPRKDTIPVRDDFFGATIALRMGEAEAKLLLPSAAIRAGAMPWTFPDKPGLCCMWDPDEHRVHLFRTRWIDDDQLEALSKRPARSVVPVEHGTCDDGTGRK